MGTVGFSSPVILNNQDLNAIKLGLKVGTLDDYSLLQKLISLIFQILYIAALIHVIANVFF